MYTRNASDINIMNKRIYIILDLLHIDLKQQQQSIGIVYRGENPRRIYIRHKSDICRPNISRWRQGFIFYRVDFPNQILREYFYLSMLQNIQLHI